MSESGTVIFETNPTNAARLLDETMAVEAVWLESELASILRHQLSASVELDLAGSRQEAAVRKELARDQSEFLKGSYRGLLTHPKPPVVLLRFVKDLAKACQLRESISMPKDVATVLYYASIAAALLRCSRRITTMDTWLIRKGCGWSLDRPWLDESLRPLLTEASMLFEKSKKGGSTG